MIFVPVDEPRKATLEAWFEDAELRHRYSRPTPGWLNYVRSEPGVYAWMIHENDVAVGHLQLDVGTSGTAHLGVVVKPELRGRGYGKRILRALLDRPEVSHLDQIVGEVEVDNVASRRCLEAVGFVQQGREPNGDGFLSFIYTRTR